MMLRNADKVKRLATANVPQEDCSPLTEEQIPQLTPECLETIQRNLARIHSEKMTMLSSWLRRLEILSIYDSSVES